jgi:hypothetical protein
MVRPSLDTLPGSDVDDDDLEVPKARQRTPCQRAQTIQPLDSLSKSAQRSAAQKQRNVDARAARSRIDEVTPDSVERLSTRFPLLSHAFVTETVPLPGSNG